MSYEEQRKVRIASKPERKRRLIAITIVFSCVLSLVLLIAAELGARLWKWGSFSWQDSMWIEDPGLIYRLNPSNPDFPQSFRGQAPPTDVNNLIICLGGSTTFGFRVKYEESWPYVLGQSLNTQGKNVEVVNAGVSGYGTRQLLIRYRRDLRTYPAKLVVVFSGWNRTGALVDRREWTPRSVARPGDGWARKPLVFFAKRSLLSRGVIREIEKRNTESKGYWQMEQFQETYETDIRALAKAILENGQTPVFVLYPSLYHDDMSAEELKFYEPQLWTADKKYNPEMLAEVQRKHEALRTTAKELEFMTVDVHGQFASHRGEKRTRLFLDEMHLSVTGNALTGQILAKEIGPFID